VIGAAIGTLGGLSGGALTVVGQVGQQRRQQQIERERRLDDVRRDAYSACISSAKQLSAAWWKLADRLREEDSSVEHWQEAAAEAHATWAPFSAAVAAVTVAGPGFVADAADVLRGAMYNLDMAGTAWHDAARRDGNAELKSLDDRYMEAVETKREPGRAFQMAARRALNAES
jgi:hypothetical protein